ncbi:MAG: hydrogenase maturation nickel metallochaperone HypA [Pseudomonadota bacterium]|jgi:hydrogenase nickel incorporation protein HypA/HybF
MHEMSIAESVLQIVEETVRRQHCARVIAVRLEIGRLSGIEPEALSFCFDAVTRDSIAAGAKLEIIDTPGAGWCMQCSDTVPIAALYDACPRCGSYQVQPTQGTEMRIKELEVV